MTCPAALVRQRRRAFFCVTSIIGPTAKEVVQHDWPAGTAVMNPAARLIPVEA